jgi:hypothetical protein
MSGLGNLLNRVRLRPWLVRLTVVGGVLAIGSMVGRSWPTAVAVRFTLPDGQREVRLLQVTLSDGDDEAVGGVEVRPVNARGPIVTEFRVPPGEYRLTGSYEVRRVVDVDKNQWGDWTRVGFRHQAHFEGRDLTFPLPPETP